MQAGNLGRSSDIGPYAPTPIVLHPQATAPEDEFANQGGAPLPISTVRVLHVVNGEHFAGAERVQSHLGRCLPRYSVQADFACVKPGLFAKTLADHGGAWGGCYRTEMKNRFDVRAAWKIRQLARRNHYDLLHAHTPRTAMIASLASRLTGLPWIYHVHSPAARDSSKPLTNHLNAAVEKLSLRGCNHLITVSESLRLDCIRRGCREEDVSVVHNGVPAICPERTRTPMVGGRWVLGMVALMRPRKGLEVALEAVAKLRDRHDVRLRIIGPFETEAYKESIEDLIAQLQITGLIERVGFTENVPAELAKLDAMVLPSLYGEGLPMVVLEAMAAGLPVVATRVEGTPEAVTDGAQGLLAEPGDAESLAGKLDELISGVHDWQQMSNAAIERHGEAFSDIAMASRTADVYRKVLANTIPTIR
ncbi:D-inositol 3-phosphate glycosyltransferase [Stieleria maiorica]|uniref:D-inositol 3-phosphate glycosyltransferase n=1 Tax=Stieleria maiorica TaxID=2795974 RepID=A0A5B9MIY8_9BACT|nr:glycosyltransferase family 4 protein [Stieleria maiorica]QEF99575.1 D-inositol 3-phosphate glycosyltransferase [Stieleria maiorica]